MHLEKINRFIEEYEQQHSFIFSKSFLKKISDGCEFWKNDWVEIFKKLLRRIKKGEGTPARDNEDRMRVTCPLVMNQYMIIKFKHQMNGSYYIDYFEIGSKKI